MSSDPSIPAGIQPEAAVSADPLIPAGIQIDTSVDPCADGACASLLGDPVSYDQCVTICRNRATGTGPQTPAVAPLPWWADPSITPTFPTSSGEFLNQLGHSVNSFLQPLQTSLVLIVAAAVAVILVANRFKL